MSSSRSSRREFLGAIAVLAAGASPLARAQAWPSQTVRLVTWASAGSGPDTFTRMLAERLAARWSQPVIVENRPGAVGVLGTESVARAQPDGYTILITTNSAHLINPLVRAKLPFDPIRDFEPVSQLAGGQWTFVVAKSAPFDTLADFIAGARKAGAREPSYGSFGPGSGPHLLGHRLSTAAGVRLLHVPYKSGEMGQLQDIVGGNLDSGFMSETTARAHADKLKVLAVTGSARNPALPQVPTFREAGIEGMEMTGWIGAYVPAKTPPDVVSKISSAMREVLSEPGVRARLDTMGMRPIGNAPAEFAKTYEAEREQWRSIIETAGLPRE